LGRRFRTDQIRSRFARRATRHA